MVGDSYIKDIRPAADCGMRTLWLLHNPAKEAPALVRILNGLVAAPTLTLRSLEDLDPSKASFCPKYSLPRLHPRRT